MSHLVETSDISLNNHRYRKHADPPVPRQREKYGASDGPYAIPGFMASVAREPEIKSDKNVSCHDPVEIGRAPRFPADQKPGPAKF